MGSGLHPSKRKQALELTHLHTTSQAAQIAVGHHAAIKGVASKCSDQNQLLLLLFFSHFFCISFAQGLMEGLRPAAEPLGMSGEKEWVCLF